MAIFFSHFLDSWFPYSHFCSRGFVHAKWVSSAPLGWSNASKMEWAFFFQCLFFVGLVVPSCRIHMLGFLTRRSVGLGVWTFAVVPTTIVLAVRFCLIYFISDVKADWWILSLVIPYIFLSCVSRPFCPFAHRYVGLYRLICLYLPLSLLVSLYRSLSVLIGMEELWK